MSIRFAIRSAVGPAVKEGDATVRFSGRSEAIKVSEEREAKVIGVDGGGNPQVVFNTGLDEEQVDLYRWYTPAEKAAVKKQLKELRPLIVKNYGGEAVVDSKNAFFWKKNRDVNILSLNNQDLDKFYDTKYVTHALLYLSIISGAFMAMVAPTYDWAHNKQIPLYLALETDDIIEDEDPLTKTDAMAFLSDFRKNDPEALFILSWDVLYDTQGYGAFLRSASPRDLATNLLNYIEGRLQSKKKRNCPKVFIEYAEKWKGQQTRPLLYTEAYVKAGEYFNYLQQRDKKYTTEDGTELGNNIPEVVEKLHQPKFSQDYEVLRDKVEAKWKE